MKWFKTKGELVDTDDKEVKVGTAVKRDGEETVQMPGGFTEKHQRYQTRDGRDISVVPGTEAHKKIEP